MRAIQIEQFGDPAQVIRVVDIEEPPPPGAGFVVLVLIADSRYHLRISAYGVALAATGLAAFAGTLAAPPLARWYSPAVLVPAAFLPAAAAAYVGGLFPSLVVLVCCVSVVAFAFQILKISVDALVGGTAPDAVRGRVFAVYDVLYNVAFVVAGLAMVPLWRVGRERLLLWLISAGFVLGWVLVGVAMLGWRWRRSPRQRRFPGRTAALVVGALPALAFPAPSWWWLAWVGVVPLLLVVRAAPTAREGGVRAWVGLGGFVLSTQYWLLPATGPLLAVMAAGIGALWVPWGWATQRLLSGPVTTGRMLAAVTVLPSAWVMAEAVRSWQSLGGPWALLGGSQWNQPATLASASLGGVWLTSFLLVAVNTAIAGVILGRGVSVRILALGVALGCAGIGPAWFLLGPAPPVGSTVRVALVQPGDIDDSARRQAAGAALTATLAGQRADLVVWGESSVGVDLASHPDVAENLAQLSRRVGADLLVNVDAPAATGGIYKSSVLIGPNGPVGAYRKVRLVPFGEYVPLRPLLGWVTAHTKAAAEDRRRGGATGGTARRLAHHRTVDQLRSDLLRPPPPRGATRRPDARIPEFHLDVPGKLGAAAVGQPGCDTRRRGGPPGGAHRVVRRQRGLRRAGPPTRLVCVHIPRHDRGGCSARIGHHRLPAAGGLGSGAGLFDPRRRRRPGGATVRRPTGPGPVAPGLVGESTHLATDRCPATVATLPHLRAAPRIVAAFPPGRFPAASPRRRPEPAPYPRVRQVATTSTRTRSRAPAWRPLALSGTRISEPVGSPR